MHSNPIVINGIIGEGFQFYGSQKLGKSERVNSDHLLDSTRSGQAASRGTHIQQCFDRSANELLNSNDDFDKETCVNLTLIVILCFVDMIIIFFLLIISTVRTYVQYKGLYKPLVLYLHTFTIIIIICVYIVL